MKITCYTIFDITETKVTGHSKHARLPFVNYSGQTINSIVDWDHSRNQQRNWETLTQVLSLRTQLLNITDPTITTHKQWPNHKVWTFCFDVEFDTVFVNKGDTLGLLLQDINQVPMILNLSETAQTNPWLDPYSEQLNIVFTI